MELTLIAIFTLGTLIQSAAGFGSALVAMPLLAGLLGLRRAAPLFAMASLTVELMLLLRYRHAFRFGHVRGLLIGAAVGIPFGILALGRLDEITMLRLLGAIILIYVAYTVLQPRGLRLEHPRWAYLFGGVGGFLSGAYNTSGPPYVIYGTARAWPPDEFKGNLQSVFIVGSSLALCGHLLSGNLTLDTVGGYLIALPGVVAGLVIGTALGRRIGPELFRRLVIVLLTVLGLVLVF